MQYLSKMHIFCVFWIVQNIEQSHPESSQELPDYTPNRASSPWANNAKYTFNVLVSLFFCIVQSKEQSHPNPHRSFQIVARIAPAALAQTM
jgi:hypothetical protein